MGETVNYALYNPFMDTDGEVTWEHWGNYGTEEAAREVIAKFVAGHARYPLRLYRETEEEANSDVEQVGTLIFQNGDLKEWEEIAEKEDFIIEGAFMFGPKD